VLQENVEVDQIVVPLWLVTTPVEGPGWILLLLQEPVGSDLVHQVHGWAHVLNVEKWVESVTDQDLVVQVGQMVMKREYLAELVRCEVGNLEKRLGDSGCVLGMQAVSHVLIQHPHSEQHQRVGLWWCCARCLMESVTWGPSGQWGVVLHEVVVFVEYRARGMEYHGTHQ